MDGVALLVDMSATDDGGMSIGFKCVWRNRTNQQNGDFTQFVGVDFTGSAAQVQSAVTAALKQAMADAAGIGSWPASGARFKLFGV